MRAAVMLQMDILTRKLFLNLEIDQQKMVLYRYKEPFQTLISGVKNRPNYPWWTLFNRIGTTSYQICTASRALSLFYILQTISLASLEPIHTTWSISNPTMVWWGQYNREECMGKTRKKLTGYPEEIQRNKQKIPPLFAMARLMIHTESQEIISEIEHWEGQRLWNPFNGRRRLTRVLDTIVQSYRTAK